MTVRWHTTATLGKFLAAWAALVVVGGYFAVALTRECAGKGQTLLLAATLVLTLLGGAFACVRGRPVPAVVGRVALGMFVGFVAAITWCNV